MRFEKAIPLDCEIIPLTGNRRVVAVDPKPIPFMSEWIDPRKNRRLGNNIRDRPQLRVAWISSNARRRRTPRNYLK